MVLSRRPRWRALLGAATLLVVLLSAAPAQARIDVGVQDDDVLVYQKWFGRPAGVDLMNQVGLGSVRINVPWTKVLVSGQSNANATQTARSTYNFAPFDAAIDDLKASGRNVQLSITGPFPAWATGDRKVGYTNPNATAFSLFARAVAQRYQGKVVAVSILNEPNWPTLLRTGRKCRGATACATDIGLLYRALYLSSYRAIKAASPSTKVWIGETTSAARKTTKGYATAPLEFLRAVLCVDPAYSRISCPGLMADGVAHHPYLLGVSPLTKPTSKDAVTMANLGALDAALTRFERLRALRAPSGKLPIYLTEYGFTTSGGSKQVSPSKQASWTIQGLKLAAKAKRVKQVILYQLVDPPAGGPRTWASGMLTGTFQPKPLRVQLPGALKSL
jgi:hypothetical protein